MSQRSIAANGVGAAAQDFKIIDDDLDLTKLRPLDGDDVDILGQGEDAPQIAGIIDERPEEIKKLEQFQTTSKWRVINEDDGFNSKLQIQEIKKNVKDVVKESELMFGKMYSDSEDEHKNKSDLSPTKHKTYLSLQHKSDNDLSPPRKKEERNPVNSITKNYDYDLSPTRKNGNSKSTKTNSSSQKNENRNVKPKEKIKRSSRWGDFKEEEKQYNEFLKKSMPLYQSSSKSPDGNKTKNRCAKSTESDISPPRKTQKFINKSYDTHAPRKTYKKTNKSDDSDISPPRKTKKNEFRKRKESPDSDISPPRKRNKSPDSDLSPPRKRKNSPERQKTSANERHDNKYRTDRHNKYIESGRNSDRRYNYIDKSSHSRDDSRRYASDRSNTRRYESFVQSPPRSNKNKVNNKRHYNRNNDSPPPTNKKMEKTLDGKKAGLQDAVHLRQENEAFRRRENEAFNKMTAETSGRNALAVSRKGKRGDSEERRKMKEKADKQKKLDEKYKKWSKGLKQIEEQERRVQDFVHEASKPLARHRGDKDLENRLKDVEREGDPMLKYIREKKRERGGAGPSKPSYKGNYPPNRFNIRPGYRWDGVNRSNGYERKFFEHQSRRKAQAEEAYKWSTEDL